MPDRFLKIAAISDLHFGHTKINAENLYMKLRSTFYPEVMNSNLIVVAGDLYDQLLTINSKAHKFASMFIRDLLLIARSSGAQIRLLHGTFSHDRDQLSIYNTLVSASKHLKTINEITCEEIKEFVIAGEVVNFPLRIVYLPDNLPFKYADEAVEHIQNSMACKGWTTADLVIGHGTFEHTIPPESGHKPICLYRLGQFSWAHGPIIMGHIHTPSKSYNCYYCGSFERMNHGEEEHKGFLTLTKNIDKNTEWEYRFVKNPNATLFKTIVPEGNDTAFIVNNFISQVKEKFGDQGGFVRVAHPDAEVRSILHRVCAEHFPNISYSSKSTGQREVSEMRIDEITLDIFDNTKPNVKNLGNLVYKFLEENNILDGITQQEIDSVLSPLLV